MDSRFAVLADIHGNAFALEAVLADIAARGISRIVTLGDALYGPLDPDATFAMLMKRDAAHIRGNGDGELLLPSGGSGSTMDICRENLSDEQRRWLESLPATCEIDGMFLCHGTPASDGDYLLESMGEAGGELRPVEEIEKSVGAVSANVVLCGHSHVPRVVKLPSGKLVVNPGSVGLPAYYDAAPVPHMMESGVPHAKYAVLSERKGQWTAEVVRVVYDWGKASAMARKNGRDDWAACLETGRATRP